MITFSAIRRAVLTRFMPATGAFFFGFVVYIAIRTPTALRWPQVYVSLLEVAGLSLGFFIALTLYRTRLDESAGVVGRRSVVAGFCSPLALGSLSVFTQGQGIPGIAVLSTLAGAALGLAMFAPWAIHASPVTVDSSQVFDADDALLPSQVSPGMAPPVENVDLKIRERPV